LIDELPRGKLGKEHLETIAPASSAMLNPTAKFAGIVVQDTYAQGANTCMSTLPACNKPFVQVHLGIEIALKQQICSAESVGHLSIQQRRQSSVAKTCTFLKHTRPPPSAHHHR